MEENTQLIPPANPISQAANPIPASGQKSSNRLIPILLVITLLTLIAGVYFYLSMKTSTSKLTKSTSPTSAINTTATEDGHSNLTGKIEEISQDLGLIVNLNKDNFSTSISKPVYYEAGTYLDGDYKGYKRYLLILSAGQGSPLVFTFASLDNKKYILDADPNNLELQKTNNYDPLSSLNKSKISKITPISKTHPSSIRLDSQFTLNKNIIPTTFKNTDTGKKTKDGYDISESSIHIITDFSSYFAIKSPDAKLTFYQGKKPEQYHEPTITPSPLPEDQYINGTTQVIAVDSTGLAYSYDLTNPQKAAIYPEKMAAYNKAVANLQKSGKKDTQPYPEYPNRPNLSLNKTDITTTSSLYYKYQVALPGGCAFDVNTLVLKNISDRDFQKIGTSSYGDVFILSDKNHPLVKGEYEKKLGIYNDPLNSDLFAQINKIKKPSYDEYVANNPLIFFKDYWGRWVALGEYDINLPGGCGKPVVYLYPSKPTKISVQFTTPIKFDITIPHYQNGWKVLAQPDGTLSDLQPQFTDCDKIDSTKKGSEYAKKACLSSQYPYLYWAGQSTEKQYPKIDKGWIVDNKNLTSFLNQKLDEVMFTQKEKNDFLEYWLPELKSKKANYYRISFLQTAEMNSIAPMLIIPQPKNIYRLFLDYSAYKNKPVNTVQPQALSKIVREGFTVIEWGGLKGVILR